MARLPLFLLVPLIALAIPPAPFDVVGTATVAGKGISDAVIWLDAPSAPRPEHAREAVLDQRNMNFFPHVLVVQVGTRVKFPNDDRVFHNVFSYHDGKRFDLGLYPVGAVKYVPFDQPGLSRIFCNIHSQMAAYVMVVDTPYFALSDGTGRFEIAGVPPGEYSSHAWRPGGPILNIPVIVGSSGALDVRWP